MACQLREQLFQIKIWLLLCTVAAIGEFQFIQGKIADMYTELNASRSYLYAVAKASVVSGITLALALVTLYLILRTKINPVLVILGSGGLGALLMAYLK